MSAATLPLLLSALGSTPNEVADTLRASGCLGRGRSLYRCPVAAYLHSQGVEEPFVTYTHVEVGTGRHRTSANLPGPVARFVEAFDRGDHPMLEGGAP